MDITVLMFSCKMYLYNLTTSSKYFIFSKFLARFNVSAKLDAFYLAGFIDETLKTHGL